MASDLIERTARAAYPDVWAGIDAAPDTREAIDDALLTRVRALAVARLLVDVLREPSEAMLDCGTFAAATGDMKPEHAEVVALLRRQAEEASRRWFRSAFRRAVAVFAREHSLEVPDGE